ncbi:glycosyltransferase [Baekduia sp. Peel2402]|uniref:glycosyltransferase n=1 Tax=Baekduia sp. Peel2402 TaxID=3458296 RepID=UPI00403E9342
MRILFSTRGSAGHVLPMAPFAHAAVRAGHDVLVAAQEQNAGNVARTGLPHAAFAAPTAEQWRPLMAEVSRGSIDAANARMIGEGFAGLDARAALPGLEELVDRWRPDVVVRESMELASALVAERAELPVLRVALGLAAVEELAIGLSVPAVDALRAELGLVPDPDGERLRATPLLTMVPAALEAPGAPALSRRFRQPVAALGPGAAAPLPRWWSNAHDPLVYMSFGSVAGAAHMPFFPALYRFAIQALAPLPARVLLTLGDGPDPALLGPLPDNVHVERWIPQEAILPHADAAILHGGYGSTMGALSHGVPQVVLPLFSIDQWANAEAVERVGAGLALNDDRDTRRALELPAAATLAGLADAVEHVLEDGAFRRRAGAVASAIAELPPVESAVGEIAAAARALASR